MAVRRCSQWGSCRLFRQSSSHSSVLTLEDCYKAAHESHSVIGSTLDTKKVAQTLTDSSAVLVAHHQLPGRDEDELFRRTLYQTARLATKASVLVARRKDVDQQLLSAIELTIQTIESVGITPGLPPRGCATLAWCLAKTVQALRHCDKHTVEPVASAALAHLVGPIEQQLQQFQFNSQDIANTVWAYTTVAHASASRVFVAVSSALHANPQLIQQFTPQELSITVWSFAKLDYVNIDDVVFDQVAYAAAVALAEGRFQPQDIANTLWAYAKRATPSAKVVVDSTVDALRANPDQLRQFSPQALSNTVWALSTLGMFSTTTADLMTCTIVDRMLTEQFRAQEISNMVWAYATALLPNKKFFDAVTCALTKPGSSSLWSFKFQELQSLLWGYASMDRKDPDLFAAIAPVVIAKAKDCPPSELVSVARSFADTLNWRADVFDCFGQVVAADPMVFTPELLTHLAVCLARVGFADQRVFSALASHLQRDIGQFIQPGKALWALAQVGIWPPGDDPDIALQVILSQFLGFTLPTDPAAALEDLVMCLWASACLSGVWASRFGESQPLHPPRALGALYNFAITLINEVVEMPTATGPTIIEGRRSSPRRSTPRPFRPRFMALIHRSVVQFRSLGLTEPTLLPLFAHQCRREWETQQPMFTNTHHDIHALLSTELGVENIQLDVGDSRADIVFRWKGSAIAIEVLSESEHLLRQPDGAPNGMTIARRVVIRSEGLFLVSIRERDWTTLDTHCDAAARKNALVVKMLDDAVATTGAP